ncbi:MAG: hypothetical protein KF742_01755 [Cryobacterium sp.]|nr:hypothetical protein [Cryobacterium sp.]
MAAAAAAAAEAKRKEAEAARQQAELEKTRRELEEQQAQLLAAQQKAAEQQRKLEEERANAAKAREEAEREAARVREAAARAAEEEAKRRTASVVAEAEAKEQIEQDPGKPVASLAHLLSGDDGKRSAALQQVRLLYKRAVDMQARNTQALGRDHLVVALTNRAYADFPDGANDLLSPLYVAHVAGSRYGNVPLVGTAKKRRPAMVLSEEAWRKPLALSAFGMGDPVDWCQLQCLHTTDRIDRLYLVDDRRFEDCQRAAAVFLAASDLVKNEIPSAVLPERERKSPLMVAYSAPAGRRVMEAAWELSVRSFLPDSPNPCRSADQEGTGSPLDPIEGYPVSVAEGNAGIAAAEAVRIEKLPVFKEAKNESAILVGAADELLALAETLQEAAALIDTEEDPNNGLATIYEVFVRQLNKEASLPTLTGAVSGGQAIEIVTRARRSGSSRLDWAASSSVASALGGALRFYAARIRAIGEFLRTYEVEPTSSASAVLLVRAIDAYFKIRDSARNSKSMSFTGELLTSPAYKASLLACLRLGAPFKTVVENPTYQHLLRGARIFDADVLPNAQYYMAASDGWIERHVEVAAVPFVNQMREVLKKKNRSQPTVSPDVAQPATWPQAAQKGSPALLFASRRDVDAIVWLAARFANTTISLLKVVAYFSDAVEQVAKGLPHLDQHAFVQLPRHFKASQRIVPYFFAARHYAASVQALARYFGHESLPKTIPVTSMLDDLALERVFRKEVLDGRAGRVIFGELSKRRGWLIDHWCLAFGVAPQQDELVRALHLLERSLSECAPEEITDAPALQELVYDGDSCAHLTGLREFFAFESEAYFSSRPLLAGLMREAVTSQKGTYRELHMPLDNVSELLASADDSAAAESAPALASDKKSLSKSAVSAASAGPAAPKPSGKIRAPKPALTEKEMARAAREEAARLREEEERSIQRVLDAQLELFPDPALERREFYDERPRPPPDSSFSSDFAADDEDLREFYEPRRGRVAPSLSGFDGPQRATVAPPLRPVQDLSRESVSNALARIMQTYEESMSRARSRKQCRLIYRTTEESVQALVREDESLKEAFAFELRNMHDAFKRRVAEISEIEAQQDSEAEEEESSDEDSDEDECAPQDKEELPARREVILRAGVAPPLRPVQGASVSQESAFSDRPPSPGHPAGRISLDRPRARRGLSEGALYEEKEEQPDRRQRQEVLGALARIKQTYETSMSKAESVRQCRLIYQSTEEAVQALAQEDETLEETLAAELSNMHAALEQRVAEISESQAQEESEAEEEKPSDEDGDKGERAPQNQEEEEEFFEVHEAPADESSAQRDPILVQMNAMYDKFKVEERQFSSDLRRAQKLLYELGGFLASERLNRQEKARQVELALTAVEDTIASARRVGNAQVAAVEVGGESNNDAVAELLQIMEEDVAKADASTKELNVEALKSKLEQLKKGG